MWQRVDGSSAPNGSSIRMMRGWRISVRAIATRWRMPPESSCGYLWASRVTSRPDLVDPLSGLLAPLLPATPRHSRPKATLSSTVRLSNDV